MQLFTIISWARSRTVKVTTDKRFVSTKKHSISAAELFLLMILIWPLPSTTSGWCIATWKSTQKLCPSMKKHWTPGRKLFLTIIPISEACVILLMLSGGSFRKNEYSRQETYAEEFHCASAERNRTGGSRYSKLSTTDVLWSMILSRMIIMTNKWYTDCQISLSLQGLDRLFRGTCLHR